MKRCSHRRILRMSVAGQKYTFLDEEAAG